MGNALERMGCFQYEGNEEKYTLVGSDGSALLIRSYWPFYGAHIPSLGLFVDQKFFNYMIKESALTNEELDWY